MLSTQTRQATRHWPRILFGVSVGIFAVLALLLTPPLLRIPLACFIVVAGAGVIAWSMPLPEDEE